MTSCNDPGRLESAADGAAEKPPRTRAPGKLTRKVSAGLGFLFLVLAVDSWRPPETQWSARLALLAIDGYQATLSKAMPSMGVECRFTPTCSYYTEEAIRRNGLVRGVALGARRLSRCGPWTEAGTHDPPP